MLNSEINSRGLNFSVTVKKEQISMYIIQGNLIKKKNKSIKTGTQQTSITHMDFFLQNKQILNSSTTVQILL